VIQIPELDAGAWVNMFNALPEYRLRAIPGEPTRIIAQIPKKKTSLSAAQQLLEVYAAQVTDKQDEK